MEVIENPVDGMEFGEGTILCPCGESVYLWFNGGELDYRGCKCGRVYYTEHRSTVLRIEEPPVQES